MKKSFFKSVAVALAALIYSAPSFQAKAGSYFSDFDSGLPDGTAVFGNSLVSTNDGTGRGFTNSACLQLTTATASQNGGFVILNDLDAGAQVASFIASFKVLVGGGTGADGFSFNYAPDLPFSVMTEEGAGSGITVSFDSFSNGASDPAPSISVKVFGGEIVSKLVSGLRAGTFVDSVIQLNPDATLTVIYDGVYVYSNLDLSFVGFTSNNGYPQPGSFFGFGSRTGSVFDNHFIDNLSITTYTNGMPFVSSFLPIGRQVKTNDPVDIIVTDNTTMADTNTVVLKLDGTNVTTMITNDGSGHTYIHFDPPTGYAYASTHTVSLSFLDNSTPAAISNGAQYSFTVLPMPPAFGSSVTVFRDDFESYVSGNAPLDKNYASGANVAANGTGNPWFGPAPPNARVVGMNETGVTPHSGTNMIKGSAVSDLDENWYNLSYRLHGGQPYRGNVRFDWWFYDPAGPGNSGFRDYGVLGFYTLAPGFTDYPITNATGGVNNGSLNTSPQIQRLSLGAGNNLGSGFDSTKYQARVVGGPGFASGWVNTSLTRSIGWHHARIALGAPLPNNTTTAYFFIDDLINPLYTQNTTTAYGLNVLELNTGTGTILGYFDDVSFSVFVPPNLAATASGSSIVLTWNSGSVLQSALSVSGPYSDVVGATNPYTNSVTGNAQQFFRLRN